MSQHLKRIYDVWDGNAEAMAGDIEELGVTVRQWRNRGEIPSRAWPKIIRAAATRGEAVRLEDFLPPDVREEIHAASPSHDVGCASATKSGDSIAGTEWPVDGANISPEIIRDGTGEADSHGPFPSAKKGEPPPPPSSAFPSTCSMTLALSGPSSNPVCSTGEAEAA